MNDVMDLAAFEDLLDRHGGDIGTWPAARRDAAAALLATSSAAGKALDATQLMEQALRATREAGAPASGDTFAATAMRHRQQATARRRVVQAGWGAAAAAVLVLGIAIGNVAASQHDESPERLMALSLDTAGSSDVD